jgi:DNA helicase-2/ATP-dependent DNA helicase PcrA
MTPSFLQGLNPEQLEAVTLPHQPALILAGAGSGKTRVLTTRIAWLISTQQVSPMGVLAVTFTNKAAREMLTRLSAMLPINTRGMWIGTFHGLCNRFLRAHHREARLPQTFQILDTQDQLAVVKRVMKGMNVDEEKYPPRQVSWYIADQKENGRRAAGAEAWDPFSNRAKEIYAVYEAQCQREGVADFAELLLRAYEVLAREEGLREHYRNRFRHILVDEFQDTNPLQYKWLKLLAGAHAGGSNAIFAVGDDDQSIYSFRGATTANMQDFQRDFAVEKVIKLEQNYRSHGNILAAANALISQNRQRLGKNLWTAETDGEKLRVYEAGTDIEEAGFIVEEAKMLKIDGAKLTDIAVLYRSNAQSRVLEHALFAAGMPYRVYGGLRFFERQEIKHAIAYLRLLASDEDDGAFLRVVNFPTRGIGARTLEQVQDLAGATGMPLWAAAKARAEGGGMRDEGKKPAVPSSLIPHPSSLKGVPGFIALIESMRAATQNLPLPEIVEHVIEHSGLKAHYQSEKDGQDRVENLNELVTAAANFVGDEAQEDASLAAFLAHAALEAGDNQAEAGADALQLMTVHSAKGLEFHAVFISGLEEGLFPHENSLNQADGLEEERRLMYVALTRARRRLYLSFTQSRMLHGQVRYNVASRFLEELPSDLLKQINHAPRRLAAMQTSPAYAHGYPSAARGTPTVSSDFRIPAAMAQQDVGGFRIGQNVVHAKFGAGVIVSAEGRGADARVQVKFRDGGQKWLALEYANLTAV